MKGVLLVLSLGLIVSAAYGQQKYKVCSLNKHRTPCEQLQRGLSDVNCQYVQDSIECAKRLKNGTADFGVVSAESALQMAVLQWNDIAVVKQLRNKERLNVDYDFQSVVVVQKDHTGGLEALKNKQFCHPGLNYGRTQKWSERFSKHFERTVVAPECNSNMSPAEIETSSLSKFFGKSCRPGVWSHDFKEDARLKKKYSNLCAMCDSGCKYDVSTPIVGMDVNHQGALDCLKRGGDVAYVAKSDAKIYFEKGSSNDFRYLCPNGTVQAIMNNNNPCTWLSQPWKGVISAYDKRENIETKLNIWIEKSKSSNPEWTSALVEILDADNFVLTSIVKETPINYLRKYRTIPEADTYCNTEIPWCTRNDDEKDECNVIRAGGISTGVFPVIVCNNPLNNTIECMEDIRKNNSQFMGIDSNYGYLARELFELGPAMFFETEQDQYSQVVVAVRDGSKYKKFQDLKGAHACLPEFGGVTSVAFVNLGKERKFMTKKECRYGNLLEQFFGTSCAPGSKDLKYLFGADNPAANLCELCLQTNLNHPYSNFSDSDSSKFNSNPTCAPTADNRYFGNRGALRCLQEQGDVAILEMQSLSEHAVSLALNESDFRIICRNGSLASYTGFNVDSGCVLTTIVDGEIVVRRDSKKSNGVVNTLNALDKYFAVDPDFKMYNIYNGRKNLLFKDSTIGLVAADQDNKAVEVQNYIKLFQDVDRCNGASGKAMTAFTAILVAIITKFLIQ